MGREVTVLVWTLKEDLTDSFEGYEAPKKGRFRGFRGVCGYAFRCVKPPCTLSLYI